MTSSACDGDLHRPIPESPALPAELVSWRRVCIDRIIHTVYLALGLLSNVIFAAWHWLQRPPPATPLQPDITSELLLMSVTQLARAIRQRRATSVAVVSAYIARLDAVDVTLNCVTERRFDAALREAAEADNVVAAAAAAAAAAAGDDVDWQQQLADSKPLLGVPFTAKDSIAIGGLRQTGGLWLLRDSVAPHDAVAVKQLRAAGAIPLAHTNVPELGMWWETNNTIYGRTCNPYRRERISGGSSGGEAALLAAAGTPLSLGSDIGGSIRMPAFFCGVFGLKPSAGAVSNVGHLSAPAEGSLRDRLLVAGPLVRHSEDLLLVYDVLSRRDAAWRLHTAPRTVAQLRCFYVPDAGGACFASPVHIELRTVHERLCHQLRHQSHVQLHELRVPALQHQLRLWLHAMQADVDRLPFAAELVGQSAAPLRPLPELLRWLTGRSRHTLAALGLAYTERLMTLPAAYGRALHQLQDYFNELLGDDGVLLYPTHPTPAPYHNQPLLLTCNFSYTAVFNALQLPVVQVPLGLGSWGVPLGIQVVAGHGRERLCLLMAEQLEKLLGGWVCPSSVKLE